jgi:membrane associated rhomboid family serine protease
MLSPPSLKYVPQYPVTASVAAAAIGVTILWWTGHDIGFLLMDERVWDRWEIWRAPASTLPHVSFFHLAFNLYWLWTFGTLVERIYGHLKCAAIFLLLATGSMLAEFSLLNGGVGLSGLGYGLWGMILILEQRDRRFADAVDRRTNQTFAVWFVICIVLTVTNVMPVANIAHGAGAVLGILLGLAISGQRATKWQGSLGLAALFSLCLLGATVFWPYVNLSRHAGNEIERAALSALERHDLPRAIKLLNISAHKKNAPAQVWYNLGVAYGRAEQFTNAVAAYEHAAELPDADTEMQQIAEHLRTGLSQSQTNQ